MDIQSGKKDKRLVQIITSIGKTPLSWQDWRCLHIELDEEGDKASFSGCIPLIQPLLQSYFKEIEGEVFFCENFQIHLFCKNVSKRALAQAGEQIRHIIEDETSLSSALAIYDLEQEGPLYVRRALKQEDESLSVSASAYADLYAFPDEKGAPDIGTFAVKTNKNRQGQTRVLLVEDDPVTRWMVRKSLKHDCDLVTAATANKSFSKIHSFQPDIVFLDIDLPDKNGREVLSWLMRNDPGLCVVMFSSNNNLDNIAEALEEGASGFIAKPFLKEQLLHYIQNHSG